MFNSTTSKEEIIVRKVHFEKCKKHDFENLGLKYWYDKNGNVIRIDDENSSLDLSVFSHVINISNAFLEAGYVFMPYIPVLSTEIIFNQNEFSNKKLISRYATTEFNTSYYGNFVIQ